LTCGAGVAAAGVLGLAGAEACGTPGSGTGLCAVASVLLSKTNIEQARTQCRRTMG
jgi:hypothetical protein